MKNVFVMRVRDCLDNLQKHDCQPSSVKTFPGFRVASLQFGDELLQGLTRHVLHGEKRRTVAKPRKVMDRNDVGVLQSSCELGLAEKKIGARFSKQFSTQAFEGNFTIEN